MEFDEGESAFEILDQRRAILDPVAAVHVKHVAEVANFRPVNVTANHARHAALARELNHRILVIGHIFHRRLRFQFDVARERPISETERAPRAIDPHVQVENAVVQRRPHAIE